MTGMNPRRLLAFLAMVGVLCLGGVAGVAYLLWPDAEPPAPVSAGTEAAPPSSFGAAPSFDLVRVGPLGALLAGRAEPGATVVVVNNNIPLGQARADGQGEWMLASAAVVAPGGQDLSLSARGADGRDVKGEDAVLPGVSPPPSGPAAAPLVPQAGAPEVLDAAPDGAAPPAKPGPERQGSSVARLALHTVDYDNRRATRFTGEAPPGATVRAFLDDAPVGDVAADAQGRWAVTPQRALPRGAHRLRIDQLDASGQVLAQVELPFQRVAVPPAVLGAGRVVVQPGQTLWRMARRAYGAGVRYTVIFLANRDQIRDPRLIRPGQALAMPVAAR